MRIIKAPVRASMVAAVVSAVALFGGASPALATHSGAGSGQGYETPPESVTFTGTGSVQCARFNATSSDPLIHDIQLLSGTFLDASGSGSAEFTNDDPYVLGPGGTFGEDTADTQCSSPGVVTGTMTIEFEDYFCTTGTSETATYERVSDEYTLTFEGTCDDTTTGPNEAIDVIVVIEGFQNICPNNDCGTGSPPDSVSSLDELTYSVHQV